VRFAGIHSVINADVTFIDILQLINAGIGIAFPIAVGIIIIGPLLDGGRACPPKGRMRRNPETGQDEPSVDIEIVGPDQPCS
jgi:hypothetical protein